MISLPNMTHSRPMMMKSLIPIHLSFKHRNPLTLSDQSKLLLDTTLIWSRNQRGLLVDRMQKTQNQDQISMWQSTLNLFCQFLKSIRRYWMSQSSKDSPYKMAHSLMITTCSRILSILFILIYTTSKKKAIQLNSLKHLDKTKVHLEDFLLMMTRTR